VISCRNNWAIAADQPVYQVRRLVQEFDPEMPDPQRHHLVGIVRAVWANALKTVFRQLASALTGCSAPTRSQHLEVVPIARAAAIPVVRAAGQECAERCSAPCETSACAGAG